MHTRTRDRWPCVKVVMRTGPEVMMRGRSVPALKHPKDNPMNASSMGHMCMCGWMCIGMLLRHDRCRWRMSVARATAMHLEQ
eukprot:6397348-Alexandrium_andersonii.AAC.1